MSEQRDPHLLIFDRVSGIAPLVKEVANGIGLNATAVSSLADFRDQFLKVQPTIVALDCEEPIEDISPLIQWTAIRQPDDAISKPKLILVSASSEQARLLKEFADKVGMRVVAEFEKTVDIAEMEKALKSAL